MPEGHFALFFDKSKLYGDLHPAKIERCRKGNIFTIFDEFTVCQLVHQCIRIQRKRAVLSQEGGKIGNLQIPSDLFIHDGDFIALIRKGQIADFPL